MENTKEQYLNLIRDILNEGTMVEGRNGKTKCVIGSSMVFDLRQNNTKLTTKRVAWKTCLKELLWFIKGSTSNTELKEKCSYMGCKWFKIFR